MSTSTTSIPSPHRSLPLQDPWVIPITRHEMISRAAYFRAMARRFQPGHDLEDWLVAEQQIDRVCTIIGSFSGSEPSNDQSPLPLPFYGASL
jgi:hypothetical protein